MKKSAFVCSILSFLGLLSPIVGVVLGICGITLSRKPDQENQQAALIIGIIGLVVSIANWIYGAIIISSSI